MSGFIAITEVISQWTIPATILIVIVWARVRGVAMYESFITGAKEGFGVAVMIMPYLVAILFVIKVFLASGLFEDTRWLLTRALGSGGASPEAVETLELLPLALTKPLSGGASRGMLVEVFDSHGPDSRVGMTASLMMGSTETTFYVLAVYFGAVQVKRFRHTLPACLIADGVGLLTALLLGLLLFS